MRHKSGYFVASGPAIIVAVLSIVDLAAAVVVSKGGSAPS